MNLQRQKFVVSVESVHMMGFMSELIQKRQNSVNMKVDDMKNTLIQNHSLLASRLFAMASAIRRKENKTDEDKKAIVDFEEQASEYRRKARLFGDMFLMVKR
jgi:hypothetical protein